LSRLGPIRQHRATNYNSQIRRSPQRVEGRCAMPSSLDSSPPPTEIKTFSVRNWRIVRSMTVAGTMFMIPMPSICRKNRRDRLHSLAVIPEAIEPRVPFGAPWVAFAPGDRRQERGRYRGAHSDAAIRAAQGVTTHRRTQACIAVRPSQV